MIKNPVLYIVAITISFFSQQLIACPAGQVLKSGGICGPDDGTAVMTHEQMQTLGKANPNPNCARCHLPQRTS